MAYEKLTDRSELTTADDGDLVHVVDVSDNATDPAGNSKKIQVSNLMKNAPVQTVNGRDGAVTGLAEESYVDTAVGNEEAARISADNALQLSIGTNTNNIASLDTRLTTAEVDITTNATAITTEASTRAAADTALQSDVDANATAISAEVTARTNADTNLQTQVTANDGEITALDGRLTTAESDIDALEAATHVDTFNNLTGEITLSGGTDINLSTTGNTITINSTASGGGGGGNKFTDIDGVTADSGSQDVDFVASTGISITPNNTAKTITFAVSGLDTDDVSEGSNLYYTDTLVETKVNTMGLASTTYVNSEVGNEATIRASADSNLQTSINTNTSDILGLNTQVSANTGAISNNDTDIANLNTRVTDNESDILALQGQSIPTDLTDLNDTPSTYGTAGQVLATNSTANGTEWVDQSGGGGLTDTDDLPEGSINLYYADSLVNTYLVAQKIRANYPTGTYTGNTAITATHEQTMMVGNSATGITFQVSSGLARDCEILVMQYGAGDITITGATGVTIRTSSDFQAVTGGRYAIIGLKQIGTTDEYIVTGERKSA